MAVVGQVAYSLAPVIAVPGQIADNEVNDIRSFVASEPIFPGRMLELAADGVSCRQVQATGNQNPATALGFSVLLTSREGNGAVGVPANNGAVYNIGDMVPVMRKGAMYAEWSGTTQVAYTQMNVFHSSTIATNRGKITDTAASGVAGTEISLTGSSIKLRGLLPGAGNICLIDINLPGAA
jgi:hypothetical protein